jgi:transcriptional regulator with XRE-family HTH domain
MQKVRIAQGFTQEQLAEKTGRAVPNLKMLQKIARALQVKVKELIPY